MPPRCQRRQHRRGAPGRARSDRGGRRMSSTSTVTETRGRRLRAGSAELWVEQRGAGPDVLLIAGLGDPAEVWEAQLGGLCDRYRLTAFDNRGAGRSPLPDGPLSVAQMADDAAAVLQTLDIERAHVVGFSGGSMIAQELALRQPDLVRSLVLVGTWARFDPYARRMVAFWSWLAEAAPSERAFQECVPAVDLHPSCAHGRARSTSSSRSRSHSPTRRRPRRSSGPSRPSSTTRRRTGSRTSPRRHWCSPVSWTSRCRRQLGTGRRRRDPGRPVRAVAGRGPPAVPGEPAGVQRPGRRLLARGGGRRLRRPAGDRSAGRHAATQGVGASRSVR